MLRGVGESLALGGVLLLAAVPVTPQTSATAASTKSSTNAPPEITAKKTSSKHRKSRRTANWKKHGQQKIDPQRASEIQEALIREHYLTGSASGVWDDTSQKAMQRYQSDNGWQDKSTPDARALIKLGLGPDQQHLLNPESAMTTGPDAKAPSAAAPQSPDDPPASSPPKK